MKVNYFGDQNIIFDIGFKSTISDYVPFTMFADDSVNQMRRKFYTAASALEVLDLKFQHNEAAVGITQFPCQRGFTMTQMMESEMNKQLAVGLSHQALCFQA